MDGARIHKSREDFSVLDECYLCLFSLNQRTETADDMNHTLIVTVFDDVGMRFSDQL